MDQRLILQMLQMLPPERLGQLASEAVNPERVLNTPPGKQTGMAGNVLNKPPKMYTGPIGRI